MKKIGMLFLCALFLCSCGKGTEPVKEDVKETLETRDESSEDVSPADLEKAKSVAMEDVWSGETDSPYYFVEGIEEKDVELFGSTDSKGFLLRVGDKIYNVDVFADSSYVPRSLIAEDFDGDGNTEYGFNPCVEHGTGCFIEALVIVDPDETENVTVFTMADLYRQEEEIFTKIRSEVKPDEKVVSYWYEENGAKNHEGTLDVSDVMTSDFIPTRLGFGDFLAFDYIDGQWKFTAEGGIVWSSLESVDGKDTWVDMESPRYDWPFALSGDLSYNHGMIAYSNVQLGLLP